MSRRDGGDKEKQDEKLKKVNFQIKLPSFRRDDLGRPLLFSSNLGSMWASTPTECSFISLNRRVRCPHRTKKV